MSDVSRLVRESRAGNSAALSKLIPLVYDELHRLAAGYMRREQPGQTLQTTALVHEAYVRLMQQRNLKWENRAHFMAIAANLMRQILVERARGRRAEKRGGGSVRVTYDESMSPAVKSSVDLLALDEALARLEAFDPRRARIVELRFFGGLTLEEMASTLGVSPATVKRDWSVARAWLHREMGKSLSDGS